MLPEAGAKSSIVASTKEHEMVHALIWERAFKKVLIEQWDKQLEANIGKTFTASTKQDALAKAGARLQNVAADLDRETSKDAQFHKDPAGKENPMTGSAVEGDTLVIKLGE